MNDPQASAGDSVVSRPNCDHPAQGAGLESSLCGYLSAVLIASIVATGLFVRYQEYFPPPPIPEQYQGRAAEDPELKRAEEQLRWITDGRNAALCLGLYGMAVCGCLGLVEGWSRRSLRLMGLGALGGVLLGAVFGAAAGAAEVFTEAQLVERTDLQRTHRAMAMHAIAFVIAGIGAGLSVGLVTGRWSVMRRSLRGAVFGGLIAGLLYAPLAAAVFPLSHADQPIPSGIPNQFLFVALTAGLIGLGIQRTGKAGTPQATFGTVPEHPQ